MGGLSIEVVILQTCINRGLKPAHSSDQPLVDYCNKYSNIYTGQPVATQRFLLYCDPFSSQHLPLKITNGFITQLLAEIHLIIVVQIQDSGCFLIAVLVSADPTHKPLIPIPSIIPVLSIL